MERSFYISVLRGHYLKGRRYKEVELMRQNYRKNKPVHRPGSDENWVFRRGGIYTANLNPFKGSEQGGTRPVLVLQNNDGNYHCPTLIVAPISSQLKKTELPTHYILKRGHGLAMDSIVELEQIKTIDKSRIERYIGWITKEQLSDIEDVIRKSLGMKIPESVEAP